MLIFIATLAGEPTPAVTNMAIVTDVEKCQALAIGTSFIAGAKNAFEHRGLKPVTITGACVPLSDAKMELMNSQYAKP